MRKLLGYLLKTLLYSVIALVAVMVGGLLFPTATVVGLMGATLAGVGYGVYRAGTATGRRRAAREAGLSSRSDGPSRERSEAEERRHGESLDGRSVPYSEREGFDLGRMRLPDGMVASSRKLGSDRAVMHFDVDDMPQCVKAYGEPDGSVTYEYRARDGKSADRVRQAVTDGTLDGVRETEVGGGVVFRTQDASVAARVARTADPAHEVTVEREVSHVRQYIVTGASSYEDAVRILDRNKNVLEPVHSFDEVIERVDGGPGKVIRSDGPMDASSIGVLPEDAFIVNTVSRNVRKGTFTIHGDYDPMVHFDQANTVMDVSRSVSGLYQDGMPKGAEVRVARQVTLDDGSKMVLRKAQSLDGLYLSVYCSTPEEAESVLKGGVPSADSPVFLSNGRMEKLDGMQDRYRVEVPVDSEIFSRLQLGDAASPSLMAKCREHGMTVEDGRYSVIRDRFDKISSRYHAAFCVGLGAGAPLDREKATVNGVPGAVPVMDSAMAAQWTKDADRIESVTMKLDTKNSLMNMSYVVRTGLNTTTERKVSVQLTDKQMQQLLNRGEATKSEMKDFLIRSNPSLFKTYKVDGAPVFMDPVGDFANGSRTTAREMASRRVEQARALKEKATRKKEKAAKTAKVSKVKIG